MSVVRWMLLVVFSGCVGSEPTAPALDACDLAEASASCPECSDGPQECTFGDTSFAANSCGDCQARAGLLAELCAAGETATADEIEAGITCSPVTCVEGPCGCETQCWSSDTWAVVDCATCSTPLTTPDGECTFDAAAQECAFVQ